MCILLKIHVYFRDEKVGENSEIANFITTAKNKLSTVLLYLCKNSHISQTKIPAYNLHKVMFLSYNFWFCSESMSESFTPFWRLEFENCKKRQEGRRGYRIPIKIYGMAKYLLIYILWLLCKIWFTVHWIYILYCRNFHFFLLHFFGKLRNVFNHRRLCKTKEGKNLDGILRVETLFLPPLDFQPKPLE